MTVEIRPLAVDDDRRSFRSGDEALDLLFHRYAGQNQFRFQIGVTCYGNAPRSSRSFMLWRVSLPHMRD